jgi:plasmid stabilization system protein ParE
MASGNGGYQIVVTPESRDGLQQIVEYLEENVSFQTADYVRQAILNGIDTLLDRPERHAPANELNDSEIFYRRVLVLKGKYRIIYTIIETKTEVRVIDISRSGRGPEYLEEVKRR